MLFNSIQFLVFFPIVIFLYFSINYKFRWILLLIASYYFYMCWKPEYAVLIAFTTIMDYFLALKIHSLKNIFQKKLLLTISILLNLSILFFFKYLYFFTSNFNSLFQTNYSFSTVDFILPVGISFYTFQSTSYIIDVYRGNVLSEKNLAKYALYVSFFPQLVAGPIERAGHLLPQLFQNHSFDYDRITSGIKRMAWGFFKKIVVADKLALIADNVFNSPQQHNSLSLLIGIYAFTFQIYCDFSGYSDIAVGTARILGINLAENFKTPYFSSNIVEFWKRWHITLISWFRDYLYIPLGGNRVKKSKWVFNILIVFLLSGLWHGANWTFVVWGLLNGLLVCLFHFLAKKKNENKSFLKTFLTFHLVAFLWIFFRAKSIDDALLIISNLFSFQNHFSLSTIGINGLQFVIAATSVLLLLLAEYFHNKKNISIQLGKLHWATRWSFYLLCVAVLFVFGEWSSHDFIYFQF